MSLKRRARGQKQPTPQERKRRELQGYLDKLRQVPNPSQRDQELQHELKEALTRMKR